MTNNTKYLFLQTFITGSSWSLVLLWHLMIMQLYYATGHQPTMTGMRLYAGFVGLHGDMVGYRLAMAAILVALNTSVAQVKLVMILGAVV